MRPLTYHPDFLAGRYRSVVDKLLEKAPAKLSAGHLASLVGALSFLGRLDEAEAVLAEMGGRNVPGASLTVSRFFLGVGYTRHSAYGKARRLFLRNAREAGDTVVERFYVLQGKVFYDYYTGRFRSALRRASRARRLALEAGDLFARTLATDALGQSRAFAGEVHRGIRLLEEARSLALRLGNESVANSVAVSLELHDAELGLSGEAGVARLERRLGAVGTEDNYSLANAGLELARQYTLRGRFLDSARVLETVAPVIYREQNRRQEITLNLRLAELAFQRGDHFGARHFLRSLDRLLHREADATFELAALGLGRKIALAAGNEGEAAALLRRGLELARDFGTTRDDNLQVRLGLLPPERENREDLVHCALQASRLLASAAEKLGPLLERRLLAAAAEAAGLAAGKAAVAVLPQGLGLLARDRDGIHWQKQPLSSLQAKLLRLIASRGGADKARLVELVWGYRYDPLRHDAMVYTALSSLRRGLGAAGSWLQASDTGYDFTAAVLWPEGAAAITPPAAGAETELPRPAGLDPSLYPQLNHRQLEILSWLRDRQYVAVGDCRLRFDVSEVTALRDLDGLRRQGLVVRNGRARATRYFLPGATP